LKKGEGMLIHFMRRKIRATFAEIDYQDIETSMGGIEKILETLC
jgi:hypothetical protein